MLFKTDWNNVRTRINSIANSENSYRVGKATAFPAIDRFSDNGLSQLGQKMRFPAAFIRELADAGHTDLAEDIIRTRKDDFFLRYQDGDTPLLFREFKDDDGCDRIHGVLSDKYSVFDDKEVADIIESSDYLMNAAEVWANIDPDHFHSRFISGNKLTINGDPSPLSMCVFVDNSMVGKAMLTIRFGLYRWACTNGMITGLKQFNIVREKHIGANKYWNDIVASSMENIGEYENMLLDMVRDMSVTHSTIYGMADEDATRYIKDKLATSTKMACKILDFYHNTYGGQTRWDLCNAITDVAHELDNLENRLWFESKAMKVA